MDNEKQVEAIKKYWNYLCRTTQKDLDINLVAEIWVRKFAQEWRLQHVSK